MAKITIKPFQELIVTEARAKTIADMIESSKDYHLGLAAFPVVIEHEDGLWCGTLKDVGPISMNNKKTIKFEFKSKEDLERFDREYGYGKFKEKWVNDYGFVDVLTQFLIKTKQAEIRKDKLVMLKISKESAEKWMGLWEAYQYYKDKDIWN